MSYKVGVEFDGSDKGFASVSDRVVGKLNSIGTAAAAVAAKGVGKLSESFLHMAKSTAAQFIGAEFFLRGAERTLEWADSMDRLSETFNISTNDLQVLEQVARTENVSVETMAHSLRKLTVAMVEARKGSGDAFDAFARFGIKTQGKSPLEVWNELGRAIGNATDQQLAMADATRILGKNADQVIPALKADLEEVARTMGPLVDAANIKRLADAQKTLERAGRSTVVTFAPILAFAGDALAAMKYLHPGNLFRKGGSEAAQAEFEDAMFARFFDSESVVRIKEMNKDLDAKKAGRVTSADLENVINQTLADEALTDAWVAQGIPKAKRSALSGGAVSSDALARIGGFVGYSDPTRRIADASLSELKRASKELADIRRALTVED